MWTTAIMICQTGLKANWRMTKPILEAFREVALNVSLGTTHPTLCWSPGPPPTVERGIGCTSRMLGQKLDHWFELLYLLPKSCVRWPRTLGRDRLQYLWFATSLFLSREKRLNFYSCIQRLTAFAWWTFQRSSGSASASMNWSLAIDSRRETVALGWACLVKRRIAWANSGKVSSGLRVRLRRETRNISVLLDVPNRLSSATTSSV